MAIRLGVENVAHVGTLKDVLLQISEKHPGIFDEPNRLWNWDETSGLAEFDTRIRTFTSATSHHRGRHLAVEEHGKHVTVGIAASASGRFGLLFLIASGKK